MKITPYRIFSGTVIAILFLLLWALLFPSIGGPSESPSKARAKHDVVQIATAVRQFTADYGYPPFSATNSPVGGPLLAALLGQNPKLNPRNTVFIEVTPFKKGRSGVLDGVFVDNSGSPYRISIAASTDNPSIPAGTNSLTVHRPVAVWSDPDQSPTAKSLSPRDKHALYVTSWD